jgi:hypothetical protein
MYCNNWDYGNDDSKLAVEFEAMEERRRYLRVLLLERANLMQCTRLVPFMLVRDDDNDGIESNSKQTINAAVANQFLWLPSEVSTFISYLLVAASCLVCFIGVPVYLFLVFTIRFVLSISQFLLDVV